MRLKSNKVMLIGAILALAGVARVGVAQPAGLQEGSSSHADSSREKPQTISTGFVFIEGELIPAPYEVVLSEDQQEVLVNGLPLPSAIPQGATGGSGDRSTRAPREGDDRYSASGRSRRGPRREIWATRIRRHLEFNETIVAFEDHPLWILDESQTFRLLSRLLKPPPTDEEVSQVAATLGGPLSVEKWSLWLSSFEPDKEFRRQAVPFVDRLANAESANQAAVDAVRRFDAVAYPLTLVGMIMSVIAFGHLLMSLPNNDAMRRAAAAVDAGSGISGEVVRATMISVVLVAGLSSLDLTWTILASQAGQMRELNPIASHFINDPMALIAFKSTATLLGCGLLYLLRNHSRAQLASWWMCLVCTMLTFRWLMFNSMFVT